MLIAICSDSHDNLANIDTFLDYCAKNKIEAIIHCGDWCAPGLLGYFREKFAGDIYGVYGNVHGAEESILYFAKLNKVTIQKQSLTVTLAGTKFFVAHYPEEAKNAAETGKYDLCLYGHTHKPWLEKIGSTTLANPGTLAGMFQKACFATYDTTLKKIELKILEQLPNQSFN